MAVTGAHVLVPIPEVSPSPVQMKICVPSGPDAEYRIKVYAYILKKAYTRDAPTTCSWCEGEFAEGRGKIYHYRDGEPKVYCSPACLISAL